MACEELLEKQGCPTYSGEQEWLQEQKVDKAVKRLSNE